MAVIVVVIVMVVVVAAAVCGSVEEWLVRFSLSKQREDTTSPLPSLLFVRSLLDDEVGITTCSWNAATEGGRGG